MIRRVVRRIRSAASLPLRPLRGGAGQAAALAATIDVITRTLADASRRRLVRGMRSRRLRVGVDIRPFYEPLTGVGWYLYHLLEALARRDDIDLVPFGEIFSTDSTARLHVDLPIGRRVAGFDFSGRKLSPLTRHLTTAAFPLLARLEGCDLYFGANYFLPRSLSAIATKRVVTVHDLTFRRFPELLQQETLENLNRLMLREIVLADAVICVSEATRRDLLAFYDLEPRRARTILSGLATPPAPGEPPPELPRRYILFVSTIEPRKNVMTLIDAFERLKARGEYDGKLVLVGKIGWKSEEVVRRLKTSAARESIVHLDYLERSTLAAVYSNAEAFVFPSLYEGFGFPLLEAMAYGVPTIAANSSSLPEVGGDATLYFEPRDAEELASRLRQVTSDGALRARLVTRGTERVKQFRWSRAAEETLRLFREVAER